VLGLGPTRTLHRAAGSGGRGALCGSLAGTFGQGGGVPPPSGLLAVARTPLSYSDALLGHKVY
jgi:hypothetical protein